MTRLSTLLKRGLNAWIISIQALISCWTIPGFGELSSPESVAIHPDSPPTEQQKQFLLLTPGIRVFEAPEQFPITDFHWIRRGEFELGYTDRIFLRGLVLSTHHYDRSSGDDMADISPVDIVIGWQRMSDPAIVSQIHILQRDRFYYWRVKDFPIPREDIEMTSTNLHLIPNSHQEAEMLLSLKAGDLISLEGYLTDVKKQDGYIWVTSRVRNDEGDGACEIVLVHAISVLQSLAAPQINPHSAPDKQD